MEGCQQIMGIIYSQKNNPTHDFIVLEISCSLQTAHSKTYV